MLSFTSLAKAKKNTITAIHAIALSAPMGAAMAWPLVPGTDA